MRLSVNVNLYVICYGQPQGLSLRVVDIFQCDFSRELHIILTIDGGSKPPPYHVVVCFVSFATVFGCLSLTMQLLLFRKNHARLACSVVNALTTAHCRYQLLRIADNRKGCPYGLLVYFNVISIKKRAFSGFLLMCLFLIVCQLFISFLISSFEK